MAALNYDQMTGAIIRCLRAGRAAWIWGPPGIGKTALVHDNIAHGLSRSYGVAKIPVWDFRINSKEPVDLRGLPAVIERDGRKVTTWVVPEDLPIEPAILFFDECNTAPTSMQAPVYQMVQEHRLGNWKAHEHTYIIAAGNREQDRAVANKLSSALGTRFGHFDLEVDHEQWCRWAARAGHISHSMIGFIHFQPGLLHAFNPKDRTSPTPRTVESADLVWQQDPPESTAMEEIAAHVGEGFATQFLAFCRLRDRMPDIELILRSPTTAPVPGGEDGMSIRFAVAAALSHKMNKDNMENCCIYLDRLGEEFAIFAVRDALARDDKLHLDNNVFRQWAVEHAEFMG